MKPVGSSSLGRRRWAAVAESFARFVEPSFSSLPNWKVVAWFPAVVAVGFVVLVIFNISGTSSGVEWWLLGNGPDPHLVAGTPRAIRSDEWLVQMSWVVSQAQHGFAVNNPTIPGGADMAVLDELPSWDWSTIFRPHLWGYLFLGLNAGIAWFWWLPAAALVIGCYIFVVTLLPRRVFTAAFFAIGIFFTPLLQWFYSVSSLWAVGWAFIAMAGVVWIARDQRKWVRILWSVVIGYVAVTMALGLYLPYMLPCILMMLAFSIGYFFRAGLHRQRWTSVLGRIAPLLVAGGVSGAVVGAFVLSHSAAFAAIGSTVYPGERSVPTGSIFGDDPYLVGFGGAPWSQALKAGGSSLLGANSSEGSSGFALCAFVVAGLVWFLVRGIRRGAGADPLLVGCIACFVLVFADLMIPGWTAVARLLLLDRVPASRFRMFLVVALPVFATLVIEKVDATPGRKNLGPALASTAVGIIFTGYVTYRLATLDPAVLRDSPTWIGVAAALLLATYLLFVRGGAVWAAALLMVAVLVMAGNVNPVYRGVFDLRTTAIGKQIAQREMLGKGAWVGVGSYITLALLEESGVESFTVVQNYPSAAMWKDIDPSSRYASVWNRLAHVQWSFGSGGPRPTNPQADVIQATFDACGSFAQKHVRYVLADVKPKSMTCLTPLSTTKQGHETLRIYAVVPR